MEIRPMEWKGKKKETREDPNRALTLYYVNILFLCMLTLVSLCFALVVYFRLRTRGTDGLRKMYTEKQIDNIREAAAEKERKELLLRIQTSLESGRSTTRMLREVFEDSIVVVKDGRYYFYPMVSGVEKNPLPASSLVRDGDLIRYEGETPPVKVAKGVLVSDENGKVDWDRLAGSGVAEVTVRAGTVTAAGFVPDSEVSRNCRKAADQEMRVRLSLDLLEPAGPQVLAEAADALEEIYDQYGLAGGEDRELSGTAAEAAGTLDPAVILRILSAEGRPEIREPEEKGAFSGGEDTVDDAGEEDPALPQAEEDGRLKRQWTAALQKLCGRIEEAGGAPVIGAGLYTFAARIDLDRFAQYDRWLMDHEETASFPYRFSFWEYSAEGDAEGVPASSVLYGYLEIPKLEISAE